MRPLSEKEKMLRGEAYDASDPELVALRMRAHDLCHRLGLIAPSDAAAKAAIIAELLPDAGAGLFITPPFFCDYGWNIAIGERFYANTGCVILDVAQISIGDDVMLGPHVHIYAAAHPVDPEERAALVEFGRPVILGDKVWIGGASVVCPGVTIGEGSVIGAGSVVTKDIPARVVAAGNPCRVIRPL